MFTTIVALALLSQAPAPAPTTAAKPAPKAGSQFPAKRDYSDVIARNRARRGARVSAGVARERAQQQAASLAQAKAEAEYKAALPFLLEAQRQQLERMSALERNAELRRIAAGSERIARAIEMSNVAWQNARMGYSTPALTTFGPGVSDYGPYGGVIIQPQFQAGPGQMASPYANMGFPN